MVWAFLHHSLVQIPHRPYRQSYGSIFSIKTPFSQICLDPYPNTKASQHVVFILLIFNVIIGLLGLHVIFSFLCALLYIKKIILLPSQISFHIFYTFPKGHFHWVYDDGQTVLFFGHLQHTLSFSLVSMVSAAKSSVIHIVPRVLGDVSFEIFVCI